MELGQVIGYVIEYNNVHEHDYDDEKSENTDTITGTRKATQVDIDAFLS